MAKRTPSYEETEALLRAPWQFAKVTRRIRAFGEDLNEGRIVMAKPYHNDPDDYVSIRFTDADNELHEFTESKDRIEYMEDITD